MESIKNIFLEELVSVPVPFDNNVNEYEKWRLDLANLINVDASEIVITGSACFGVSLNPYKNYRFFDKKSDIDVAIISEYFFNTSWRCLRNMGTNIHSMPPATKQSVHDHVNKYIYWGTIATDKILPYLPFGKEWQTSLDRMSKNPYTQGRKIKARIYKDFDSLRAYQVNNLKNLRTKELEKGL